MSKQNGYEIESNNNVEYVVMWCPKGHRLRGMKTSDMKVGQDVACPECGAEWNVLAPLTNGMEACV